MSGPDPSPSALRRLLARAAPPPAVSRHLAAAAVAARARRDEALGCTAGDRARAAAELALAQAIHRYVHAHPYQDRPRASRSTQWQAALAAVRDIADAALIDWLVVQAEVAHNLARGIQDMRPRKDGPTWLVLLEHVANRKRKAKAVLDWLIAAEREGGATATDRTLPDALRERHRASARLKREP